MTKPLSELIELADAIRDGGACPDCKVGLLVKMPADEPYTEEHLQCINCDGTYYE